MKDQNHVLADEVLNKDFLSQFKTEADVSKFLKQLHAQVLQKMLEGERDAHLGYEKNSVLGNNRGNSVTVVIPRRFKPNMEKRSFPFPVTVKASLSQ